MNFSVASFFKNSNSWSYKSGVEDKNKKENESYIYKMSNHCCYLKRLFLFHCKMKALLKTDISYTRPCKTYVVKLSGYWSHFHILQF